MKAEELSQAYKAADAALLKTPSADVIRLTRELEELRVKSEIAADEILRHSGLSDEEIRLIKESNDQSGPPRVDELWRADILKQEPSEDLDDLLESALDNLLGTVDLKWLRAESERPHGLGEDYRAHPLHLVNGVRVGEAPETGGPNRFARMLLLSLKHLGKHDDLDFFSASTFLPEIATLGNSLREIRELGPEAIRKLASLREVPDEQVTSTIYELLVGAAWVRRGHSITMVPEDKSKKVPDFLVSGMAFPGAVECKRRLGLSKYELDEAKHVSEFYREIRHPLRAHGMNLSIEAAFGAELREISKADFAENVLKTAFQRAWDEQVKADWGTYTVRQLHSYKSVIDTRLYSPDFLQSAFSWEHDQDEWDGLLCEVEAPTEIRVSRFRSPLCLKWRSDSETALLKKSRGVLSLWADAVKQVPAGTIGFVYIAYPEGSRAAVADTRTRDIIQELEGCWHNWTKRVPVTVVNRLYARPLGVGVPDMIENTLRGATEGEEFWYTDIRIPSLIFTRQFENQD